MKIKNIAIIGGGNIGSSIAKGFLTTELFSAEDITITTKNTSLLSELETKGVKVLSHTENLEAIKGKEIIIVSVLPHQVKDVFNELAGNLEEGQIVCSIVTGVSLGDLSGIIGNNVPLFRVMPNTAIKIQESMTCIASANASEDDEKKVLHVFEKLGTAIIIDESNMGAATVIGSCGTAFALRFIRSTMQGGIEIGFDSDIALKIAAQTIKGAAEMLIESGRHPEEEIDKVTTPLGCTIAGLNEMEHQGFSSALIKGLKKSFNRIDKIPT